MDSTQELTSRFGGEAQVFFRQLGDGVVVAEIGNSLATAAISLHGRQLVNWWHKHQQAPVLRVSKLGSFMPGKAIRGGVPICRPWFGNHPTNPQRLGHGYARISPWTVVAARRM